MIKIAFFDIDGTLIDPEKKRITDNTKKALLKLKENGVKICIATGRPPEKVPDFKSEGIDFDAFLTFNGSYSFNETETIFENPLDKEDVKQIIQNGEEMGHPVVLATKDRTEANGLEEDLVEYFSIANQKIKLAPDFEELSKEEVFQIGEVLAQTGRLRSMDIVELNPMLGEFHEVESSTKLVLHFLERTFRNMNLPNEHRIPLVQKVRRTFGIKDFIFFREVP